MMTLPEEFMRNLKAAAESHIQLAALSIIQFANSRPNWSQPKPLLLNSLSNNQIWLFGPWTYTADCSRVRQMSPIGRARLLQRNHLPRSIAQLLVQQVGPVSHRSPIIHTTGAIFATWLRQFCRIWDPTSNCSIPSLQHSWIWTKLTTSPISCKAFIQPYRQGSGNDAT